MKRYRGAVIVSGAVLWSVCSNVARGQDEHLKGKWGNVLDWGNFPVSPTAF